LTASPSSPLVQISAAPIRVRYAETDQMGVVYYANYFVWFEVARAELLRSLGWSYREMEAEGVGLPVIEAHCEYRQPARYDDVLDIRTKGALVSAACVRFDYEVVRRSDGIVTAVGRTVHAAIDPTGKPCRLPERVRTLFGFSTEEKQ
jgi:acyl-CoA thioester hydrolase